MLTIRGDTTGRVNRQCFFHRVSLVVEYYFMQLKKSHVHTNSLTVF